MPTPAHPLLPRALCTTGRRTLLWRLLAVCGVLGLAGCAVAPVPRLPDATPAAWQNANDDGAPTVDLRGWWKAFNDAELDRLVDAALKDNLTIAQAALRIDAARVLDTHHTAAFLPQFGFRTYAEPTPDSSASYFQAGFDAKWEFGLFGRAQSQARISAGELGIAKSDAQAARVSVIAEVVRAYVELRAAQQRRVLLDRLLVAAQDKRGLIQTRERLRLAAASDVAKARAELATAQAAVAEPVAAIERSRRQIALLLGRDGAGDDLIAAGDPPTLGAGGVGIDSAPADLLRTRPEIRRAEFDVLKTAGELGIARADLYPHVGLGGALTYAARVIGHTRLSDADGIVTFGPAIDIPLFDWGARRAAMDSRASTLSASLLAYRQAVLEGVAEAETAMAALHQRSESCRVLQDGVAALEQDAGATQTLHRLNLADGVDSAASRAALLQAQLSLLQGEQDRNIAFIALYKALGGAPLPPGQGVD